MALTRTPAGANACSAQEFLGAARLRSRWARGASWGDGTDDARAMMARRPLSCATVSSVRGSAHAAQPFPVAPALLVASTPPTTAPYFQEVVQGRLNIR